MDTLRYLNENPPVQTVVRHLGILLGCEMPDYTQVVQTQNNELAPLFDFVARTNQRFKT